MPVAPIMVEKRIYFSVDEGYVFVRDDHSQKVIKLREVVCRSNSPWNWTRTADRYALLEEYLPGKNMSEHYSKIIKEFNIICDLWKKSTLLKNASVLSLMGKLGQIKQLLANLSRLKWQKIT